MAKHHAGQRFHLDIGHAGALDLREIAHLCLREFDILALLRGQPVDAIVDLGLAQAIILAVPAIELHAHFAHRRIAARFDIGERRLDNIAHLAVRVALCFGTGAALEPDGHSIPSIAA